MPGSGCRSRRSAGSSWGACSCRSDRRVEVAGRGARWAWSSAVGSAPVVRLVLRAGRRSMSADRPVEATAHALAGTERLAAAGITNDSRASYRQDVKDLRVYARPPLAFYLALAGGVAVHRQPDLAHLLGAAELDLMGPARPGFDPARKHPGTRSRPTARRLDGRSRNPHDAQSADASGHRSRGRATER